MSKLVKFLAVGWTGCVGVFGITSAAQRYIRRRPEAAIKNTRRALGVNTRPSRVTPH